MKASKMIGFYAIFFSTLFVVMLTIFMLEFNYGVIGVGIAFGLAVAYMFAIVGLQKLFGVPPP